MNRSAANSNAARELRARSALANAATAAPTSIRSGLRNSDSNDRDEHLSLPPPAKRRRHSYNQNSSPRVHVSATVPNLVIKGIRRSHWLSINSSSSPQTLANGKPSRRASAEWPRSRRDLSRNSIRSPLKRRATRDDLYVGFEDDEEDEDDQDDQEDDDFYDTIRLAPSKPQKAKRPSPRRTLDRDPDDPDANSIRLKPSSNDSIHDSPSKDLDAALDEDDEEGPSSLSEKHADEGALEEGDVDDDEDDEDDDEDDGAEDDLPATQGTPLPASPEPEVSLAASIIHEESQNLGSPRQKDPNELPQDLPEPFLARPPTPTSFADEAARLHHQRYAPITTPNSFIELLTSYLPSERNTDTLLSLAQATHKALRAWQDEYLRLDLKTAPAQNPPKRPATGGRVPVEKRFAENAKEIELWGHILGVEGLEYPASRRGGYAGLGYDPPVGNSRSANAAAGEAGDGRRARRRGADAKLTDGIHLSETENGRHEKRARKPVRRFDVGSNGANARRSRRGAADVDNDSDDEDDDDGQTTGVTTRKRNRLARLRDEDAWEASSMSAIDEDANDRPGSSASVKRPTATRGRGGRRGRGRGHARTSPSGGRGDTAAGSFTSANDSPNAPTSNPSSAAANHRRPKAKSEKRSSSMTAWWAERKRKANEERMRQLRERGMPDSTPGFANAQPQHAPPPQPPPPPPPGGQTLMVVQPQTSAPPAPEAKRHHADPGPPRPPLDHARPPPPPGNMSPRASAQAAGYPVHYHPMHTMHPPPPPPPPPGHGQPGPYAAHPPPPHHQAWYPQGYPPMPPPYQPHPPPGAPHGHPQPQPPPPPPGHVLQPFGNFRIMNGR